jgi:myo-inositol-1(or 4)-monophosphatase
MSSIDRFLEVGSRAARAAGALLLERMRTDFSVAHKSETNLVTEVDIAAERLIVSLIHEAFPDHAILAEEGYSRSARGPVTWIIDPLDGTTNYAHRYPVFAVSIGLEVEGELEWGVVYNPNLGEFFTARRGQGAFCNGTRLRVSETDALGSSLLSTGFGYELSKLERNNLGYFSEFMLRSRGVRRGGAAAIDYCYVAAGILDGYWELHLHPWDSAAGNLLVREAGGVTTDLDGNPASIYQPEIVASNGRIHEQMLSILRSCAP